MKGEDHVGIKKEIENINVEVFSLPESKKVDRRLKALYLTNLAVKEISSGKGDISIVLTFQSEQEWDEAIWRWLGENYGTDVFLEFDAAQASLLDIEDMETKGEDVPDEQLPLQEAAATGDVANGKAKGKGKAPFNIEEMPSNAKPAATGTNP
jgi:hypothetical protein